VVVILVALEVFGRQFATELHDSVAALFLTLLALMVGLRHRAEPLPWLTALAGLARRAWGRVAGWSFDLGIDLRGRPPLPAGWPPALVLLAAGLLAAGGLGVMSAVIWPEGMRPALVRACYTVYLVGLLGLWAGASMAILLSVFVPTALIHDAFVNAAPDPARRDRRGQWVCVMLYFAVLAIAALVLPPWAHLAACGVVLLVNLSTLFLPANGEVQFVWRPSGGGAVRSIPWAHWVTGEFTLLVLAAFDLAVLCAGPAVLGGGSPSGTATLSAWLGLVLTWLAPGVLGALVVQTVLGRWRDPARPARPGLFLGGLPAGAELARSLSRRGWRVSAAPAAAPAEAVAVALVPEERSQADEFEPRWPLAVSVADLERGTVLDRLTRRDELQKRRRIIAALESLFKRAKRRKYPGNGYWVAPHFWFIPGLTRDASEDDPDRGDGTILSGIVGPPYHRILSHGSRHYLYKVLRALEVDLIFVEDGVTFPRFRRVLRKLFEVYDRHAGARRAEDVQFTGLPGTRVMLHEFRLDEPFKSDKYPEPKYEYLGRARILHVFRDRGEQEEPLETPFDFTTSPAPLAMV
jgi:hypothetical protein